MQRKQKRTKRSKQSNTSLEGERIARIQKLTNDALTRAQYDAELDDDEPSIGILGMSPLSRELKRSGLIGQHDSDAD